MSNFLLKITIFVFAGVALAACGGVTSTTESFAESPTLLPDPTDVPEPTDIADPTDVPMSKRNEIEEKVRAAESPSNVK